MADIFISYRRKSCEDLACLLRDRLQNRGYEVFMDVYCLGRGDYMEALRNKIRECTHFIVLLAPGDLERCHDEEDVFRQEIEFAFEYRKNIVPLFKRGFDFSEKHPESIDKLSRENGMEVSIEWLDPQIQKLTEKFLVVQTDPDPDQLPVIAENPPKGRRYGAVDEPITQYTGKTLDEMLDMARHDVTDDASLFRTIENAEQNESDAYLRLAAAYLNNGGMREVPENSEKGIYWVCKAIECQESHAMYLLGRCYEKGTGIPVNNALAAYWYEQGATQNWPSKEAVFAMADCCECGIGVADDLLTKAKWYREAMYYEEAENAKNIDEAANTFRYVCFLKRLSEQDRKRLKKAGYSLEDVGEFIVDHVYRLSSQASAKKVGPIFFFALCLCWWAVFFRCFIGRYWETFSANPEDRDLSLYQVGLVFGPFLSWSITAQLRTTDKKRKFVAFLAIILIIELMTYLFSEPVLEFALKVNPILGIIISTGFVVLFIWGFIKPVLN